MRRGQGARAGLGEDWTVLGSASSVGAPASTHGQMTSARAWVIIPSSRPHASRHTILSDVSMTVSDASTRPPSSSRPDPQQRDAHPGGDGTSSGPAASHPTPAAALPRTMSTASAAYHEPAWSDPLDLPPVARPLTSSLHPIPPSSSLSTLSPVSSAPGTPAPLDRIPSFEREFCTNFTCCGLSLSDLHELVDHFEESHVLVAQRYHPYPRVLSYPNPSPEPDYPSEREASKPRPGLVVSHSCPRPSSLSPPPPADCGFAYDPDPCAILQHQYDRPPPYPYLPPYQDGEWWDASAAEPGDGPSRVGPDVSFAPSQAQAQARRSSADEVGLPPGAFTVPHAPSTSPLPHPTTTTAAQKPKKSSGAKLERRRERAKRERGFRCPQPGCVKSYLNPNGLKYHLEKGTCVFEGAGGVGVA
ncbi:hypothetical protein GLOTRDRAFT_140308 [Gloeophyllum trabeum ATCC 11539]|uniref:C2H2-type domain-containing protein n=1 Tax=Gloeophyllum trabeum (strain ATCC 11539 / FP-39264 / Madison 617) TaxID=670483 RepID=S7PYU1_GLOTA|nr:uncharacterized protein GLOTRDRAFT_140308 [Gloeophyllum trabeum ATCC 11539]EPQ52628.1 hypothetical protein GLOTRDRAFT_140308 [Gloeophyllum trabeum ATCC 11539]